MCVLSIKVPIQKKSGNLFNDPRISERHSPNDEYENFVSTHIEAAAESIPTNQRAKCKVPWEATTGKKQDNIKKASLFNKRNPTNAIVQKLKKAQRELTHIKKNK